MRTIDTYCQSLIDTVHIIKECEYPSLGWKTQEDGIYGVHVRGHVHNMLIRWSKGKLHIKGSLPKLHNGNNFYNLYTYEVENIINRLENELAINLQDAIISRIDLAANIKLAQNVSSYFNCFGAYKNFHRSNIQESTLYYSKGKKVQSAIYDKLKEMQQKSVDKQVLSLINGNYMRYEMRCTTYEIKTLIKENLKVCDLSKIETNILLAEIWYKSYLAIQKEHTRQFNFKKGDGYKDFCTSLMMMGIDHLGGAYSTTEILKNSPDFNLLRPEYKSRIRGKIKELSLKPSILDDGGLLLELNNAFEEAYSQFALRRSMLAK